MASQMKKTKKRNCREAQDFHISIIAAEWACNSAATWPQEPRACLLAGKRRGA